MLPPLKVGKAIAKRDGRTYTDAKKQYRADCEFRFDPGVYTQMPGYELFMELGMYHSVRNPGGVCRDHMLSVEYGYRNNISPEIISHPANCQYLTNNDNITKNSASCITLEELLERIQTNTFTEPTTSRLYNRLPKKKMSESAKKNRATNQLTCPHCNKTGPKCNMIQSHFDNCKKNPEYKPLKCPHCGVEGGKGGMFTHHFDRCKHKKG